MNTQNPKLGVSPGRREASLPAPTCGAHSPRRWNQIPGGRRPVLLLQPLPTHVPRAGKASADPPQVRRLQGNSHLWSSCLPLTVAQDPVCTEGVVVKGIDSMLHLCPLLFFSACL